MSVPIPSDDFKVVLDLFRESVEKELLNLEIDEKGGIIDVDKVVNYFENMLKTKVQVVPSKSEDFRKQDIKHEIENLAKKAFRLKTQIKQSRSAFIEQVRLNIEQQLINSTPTIKDLSLDVPELPDEILYRFNKLDELIDSLDTEISRNQVQKKIDEIEPFVKEAHDFLRIKIN